MAGVKLAVRPSEPATNVGDSSEEDSLVILQSRLATVTESVVDFDFHLDRIAGAIVAAGGKDSRTVGGKSPNTEMVGFKVSIEVVVEPGSEEPLLPRDRPYQDRKGVTQSANPHIFSGN